MPEEHSQTIMAVDELQAIIQRCVSSFLSLEVTSVSSENFSSYIIIKTKMTSKNKSAVSRTPHWSSASMFHWFLCGAYPKMLDYFCFLEKEVFLYTGTKAGCCRKYIFQTESSRLDLMLLKYCLDVPA